MPEPTTWILPAPGADVTAVRDSDGDVWHRSDEDPDQWFANNPGGSEVSWADLLTDCGPLTDATTEDGLL